MNKTFKRFLEDTLKATQKELKQVNFPYLEVSKRDTRKDGKVYRGIMIKSNHPDAPYASVFYLEEAYKDFKTNPYNLDEFATKLIFLFLIEYNYITSCMADETI